MSSVVNNEMPVSNCESVKSTSNEPTTSSKSNLNTNDNDDQLDDCIDYDNNNYYEPDQEEEEEEEEDYDDEDDYCNYDDDHNNNNIFDSGEEDPDENDLYTADPEHFEYELYPLEKFDLIVEKKCEKILSNLKLDDPLDALYILKQFKWNTKTIIDLYDKDKQSFLNNYFSDNNNNNSKTIIKDKNRLTSYINIFNDKSELFKLNKTLINPNRTLTASNKESPNKKPGTTSSQPIQCQRSTLNYCTICCETKTNPDIEMFAIDECGHCFCVDCWRSHFESFINLGASSSFECMQTKCTSIASKDFVLSCLNHSSSNTFGSLSSSSISSSSFVSSNFKNYSDRYKYMIACELIKESDDLQLCPGEIVIQKSSVSTPITALANAAALATVAAVTANATTNATSTSLFSSSSSSVPASVQSTPKSTSLLKFASTNSASSTPSSYSPLKASKLNMNVETITKKCNHICWIKSKPAARRVICSCCQTNYCFLCSLPYHAPNSCQTIRKWNLKCQDDSETRNYLLVHTQDCPKCKVCIEKNGGCSHMTLVVFF